MGCSRSRSTTKRAAPFAPFFEPLFAHVESSAGDGALEEEVRGWLGSAAVNQRTSDDKTLVIAVRAP